MDYFENFDLKSIVTPIKADVLDDLLKQTNYDRSRRKFLVSGFQRGFSMRYCGPQNRQDYSDNIPLTVGSKTDLWNKVMKEVRLKRYAGPFEKVPFETFMQSPIGLVPKAGDQTRLIFHLSYNFGPSVEQASFNHHTPKKYCEVKYNDLDHAVRNCLNLLKVNPNACIFYAKTDLKSAFRLVPAKPKYFRWMLLKAQNPVTNSWSFFAEKCLPFGASVSCRLFSEFSNCLRHILETQLNKPMRITNYLDDFLFIADNEQECNFMVRQFLTLCDQIGCPVAMDKTEWSSSSMTFLGVGLDGLGHKLMVPDDKKLKTLNIVTLFCNKKKATIKEIQKLTGTLNFLNKVIVPGRAFTRGLYAKLKTNGPDGKKLLPYYHVNLSKDFKLDCEVWLKFLENVQNDRLCRPFIDWEPVCTSVELDFYTDSSGNKKLGFGGVFGKFYFWGQWEEGFVDKHNPSIAFLELFALCVGLFTWGKNLQNGRYLIFCDNKSVRDMVNLTTSNCPICLKLVRMIVLENLYNNRRIKVKYVKSAENKRADSLSRHDFTTFFKESPESAFIDPSPIPAKLWPPSRFFTN